MDSNLCDQPDTTGLGLGLELMEVYRLFDNIDIGNITKTRKELENKIAHQQHEKAHKNDYLRLIDYQLHLLEIIKKRKNDFGVNVKIRNAENTIHREVEKLYMDVTMAFKSDERLWEAYVKFCMEAGLINAGNVAVANMVFEHGNKPHIWLMAAEWHFDHGKSIESARSSLQRGLRLSPHNPALHELAFRHELEHAKMLRKQAASAKSREKTSNAPLTADQSVCSNEKPVAEVSFKVLRGQLAEQVYKTAKTEVTDVKFFIKLLEIATDYEYTVQLQDNILSYILKAYRNEELAWDTFARRELNGHAYLDKEESYNDDLLDTEENNVLLVRERIRTCSIVYTVTLKQLNTEKMWSLYLDTLIELNQVSTHFPEYKQNLLKTTFQNAHVADKLGMKYYIQWAYHVQNLNDGVVNYQKTPDEVNNVGQILYWGSKRHPHDVQIWHTRLRYHLSRGEEIFGLDVFNQCVAELGYNNEEALTLCQDIALFYQATDVEMAKLLFGEYRIMNSIIYHKLKPLFIEWLKILEGPLQAICYTLNYHFSWK